MTGLFLAVLLQATPAPEPPKPPQEGTVIEAENTVAWEEAGDRAMFLTGVVTVKQAGFEVRASRALVWFRKDSKLPLDEIYAEGNVIFTRSGQKLRAERFYYDLANDKAMIVELKGEGKNPDFAQPLVVTAATARMSGAGRLEARDVKVTTCNYGTPHYHMQIGRAVVQGKKPRAVKPGSIDPFAFDDVDVDLSDLHAEAGGFLPFLFLPDVSVGSWVKEVPLRSVQYGNSSRFGHTVLTEWGKRFRRADAEGRERTWLDLGAEGDWREERGWAFGLDATYGWKPAGYDGFVDTYFLWDQGRNLDVDFELKFPPLEREERGKAHWFHRHDFAESWRIELEAYWLSDRSFREEFFEQEFKEQKDPETVAYLRYLEGPFAAYVEERSRLNDFQTQNEYLPRAELWLQQLPVVPGLLDGLYLFQRVDGGLTRRRFDEDLALGPVDAWRLDSTSELSLPVDLGPFQLSPFGMARYTAHEDGLSGSTAERWLATAGGRLAAQLHGTFAEAINPYLGLRGLRHVMELELRYANTFYASEDNADFFAYEEDDEAARFEEVGVELRQRFLTRDDHGRPFEFLAFAVGVEAYPDSARDGSGPATSSRLFPFNWITLGPDASTGAFDERTWSNVHYDLSFTPRSFFSFRGAGEWNPESAAEEVREWEATLSPAAGFRLSGGQTFVKGVTDAWRGVLGWKVAEKWAITVGTQYDFRADDWVTQELIVSRDYHDFVLQAVVERDFGRDDERFYVTFVPKFISSARDAARNPLLQE